MNLRPFTITLALLLAATTAAADVSVPAIIGNNMVLQRGPKTAVFGKAAPGEPVTVELRTVDPTPGGDTQTLSAKTTAAPDGTWRVALDTADVPFAPSELVIKGNNELTFSNVLVGDVWICGGQSNMEWPVSRGKDAEAEIAAANFRTIRLFRVKYRVAREPTDALEGTWEVCSPETVGKFSAVGYFFGREIWTTRKVPVGLVASHWGGTPAEAWTSLDSLAADPAWFGEILKRRDDAKAKDAATAATQPVTRPTFNQNSAATLYDGMIRPLFPTTVKGALWYQGESNASRAVQYVPLLTTMIADWRRGFENPDMPFLIVQLANYQKVKEQPGDDNWAELREAQATVARTIQNGGLAVTFDVGEAGTIHPLNKQDVGHRLALQARKLVYGESSLVAAGPTYKSMVINGPTAALTFDNTGAGLTVKGDKLTGFQVAGDDQKWFWADAKLDGNTVLVSSPSVPSPTAVRYAWAINLQATLFNHEGLPATPFRTDTWPLKTKDAR